MAIDKILRAKPSANKLGLGIRTFYREVSAGNIPQGILVSKRARGWRESTLDRVIADRERGQMSTAEITLEERKVGRPRKLAGVVGGADGDALFPKE